MQSCCSPFLLRFTLLLLLLSFVRSANAQDSPDWFWRPYAEVGMRGGDVLEAGQANLFLPVYQSEVNIVFADLCGNWTDARSSQGNFGLAFRQMLVNDWIFGIHSSYDIRHSEFGNNFHRATLGLEMLNPNWGVRWNGYLAGDDPELISSLNQATLIGNNLFVQQASERAYSGHEAEIEARLWSRNGPSEESWRGWTTFYDLELWGAIGVYNYDADAPGFGSMTGPRGRLELRVFDIPFAGPDSRLVLAGQFEDDDVRGDVSSAMVTVRIPFGRGTRNPRGRLRGLNRRMVAPLVRQKEIITVAGVGELEPARFAKTRELISEVVSIDPGTAGPAGVISGAQANSLVLVNGGAAGTISTSGASINLNQGQVVLGGGGTLNIIGRSGALVAFTAPGARPTIDSGGSTAFLAANDSCIIGVDVTTSGAGANGHGILLNGSTGVFVQDVTISTSGVGAHGIAANGASEFDLVSSAISTTGGTSNAIELIDDSEAQVLNTTLSTSGLEAEGLFASGTTFLDMQNSLIFTSGASGSEGIEAIDSAQLSISGTVVTTTSPATNGVTAIPTAASDVLSILMASSTVNSTGDAVVLGGAGFTAGELNATILSNQLVSPTGANELNVETDGGDLNLSAQGNQLDPLVGTIRLSEIGGDLDVSQSSSGIGSTNGIAPTNVLTPFGTVDFLEPIPPLTPTP